jgi:transcriptional regulator with XRE-family HTH domain
VSNAALMCGEKARTVSMRGLRMNPNRIFTRVEKPTPHLAASHMSCAVVSGQSAACISSMDGQESMSNLPSMQAASQAPGTFSAIKVLPLTQAEARYRAAVPKTLKTVLADNIAGYMAAKKTNAWRLAIDAKVSGATVHRIQAKMTSPRLDVLESIAHALGVEPWQLLKPPSEIAYTEEALEIAALFDALPNEFERAKANALARLVLAGQLPLPPAPVAPEPSPAPSAPRSAKHADEPSHKPHRRK